MTPQPRLTFTNINDLLCPVVNLSFTCPELFFLFFKSEFLRLSNREISTQSIISNSTYTRRLQRQMHIKTLSYLQHLNTFNPYLPHIHSLSSTEANLQPSLIMPKILFLLHFFVLLTIFFAPVLSVAAARPLEGVTLHCCTALQYPNVFKNPKRQVSPIPIST